MSLQSFFRKIFLPKNIRVELRFVTWEEAEVLLRDPKGGWTIAKEEDGNEVLGMVYLEKVTPREKSPEEFDCCGGPIKPGYRRCILKIGHGGDHFYEGL